MKLDQKLKERIDRYFDNITAEELYEISVTKYGFKEDISFELVNESFEVMETKSQRYLSILYRV